MKEAPSYEKSRRRCSRLWIAASAVIALEAQPAGAAAKADEAFVVTQSQAIAASAAAHGQPALPAPPAPPAPTDPGGWRALAESDLAEVHRAVTANHPGAYVERDSREYRAWLNEGYRQSRLLLPRVTDGASYSHLLQGYIGGFRDVHLALIPARREAAVATRAWPGFATRWVQGTYVVAPGGLSGPDIPPAGAQLVSCDGKLADDLARERLDRFEGNLQLASARFTTAPRLLWDRRNTFIPPPPQTCRFRIGRSVRDFRLNYRPGTQEEYTAALSAARGPAPAAAGVSVWNGSVPWIRLPAAFIGEPAWQALYAEIDQRIDEIRTAPVVVIDARGTLGGSSGYANQLVRRLWGAPMLAAHRPHLGEAVWRVSPENRRFLVNILENIRTEATLSSDIPRMESMIAQFDSAAAAGQHVIREPRPPVQRPQAPGENPMRGRVIVLTDYSCVSACLDFMDLVLAMPNVEQAGTETNADTIFMEADRLTLPSGMFLLDVSHKAWPERPRGSNVPYVPRPALRYRGDPTDDAAMKEWLRKVLRLPPAPGDIGERG